MKSNRLNNVQCLITQSYNNLFEVDHLQTANNYFIETIRE